MPHYADGTDVNVGDQVTGILQNSGDKPKAGVVVSITPGADFCNAMVQFTEVLATSKAPRMSIGDFGYRKIRTEGHGSTGPEASVFVCADYVATKELTKVG